RATPSAITPPGIIPVVVITAISATIIVYGYVVWVFAPSGIRVSAVIAVVVSNANNGIVIVISIILLIIYREFVFQRTEISLIVHILTGNFTVPVLLYVTVVVSVHRVIVAVSWYSSVNAVVV